MIDALNAILVAVLVLNLLALGTGRILAVVRIIAVQGALLGVLPLLVHDHLTPAVFVVAAATIAFKGFAIPAILGRALGDAKVKHEIKPAFGLLPTMVFGALATACALIIARRLPLAEEHTGSLLLPAALATAAVGFILIITRYKAIFQVVGYLVVENGIFIFGMLLIEAMPLLVEMGVLLDLFIGIFVTSVIVNHINRAFSSMDTRRLASLKE